MSTVKLDGAVVLQPRAEQPIATTATETPQVNRVSMESFYAEPITMDSFMGATHNAQAAKAQVANATKRTRQGTNNSYAAVIAGIRPTALCQLLGEWGYTLEQCAIVVDTLWAENPVPVNGETIKTAWRDGRTHGVKKDGVSVYVDYKVPKILKALGANVEAVKAAVAKILAS